jgi:hypothetical protein
MADDSQQPVWVQGASGPIPTTPEMAAKLGLQPVDMTQYQPPIQPNPPDSPPPSTATPSAASAQLINYGIGQNDAPPLPHPLPDNAGNFPVQSQAPAAPVAPPPAAAPPAQSLPTAPPTVAPPPFQFPTGGGGGGGGAFNSQIKGQQAESDAAFKAQQAATQSAGQANADAAAIQRKQVEQGISQNAAEDAANQAMRAQFAQTRDARIAKQQALLDQDRQDKIDPNHFWGSRDAGQKVMASIGMILGSFGSALQGGGAKNAAAEIINKAIDQDYEAQKQNIANKHANTSAQGDFVQQVNAAGLSDVEAKELHRIRALDTVQKNVEMLSKTATSPQAQAAAQAALAQVQQEKAQSDQKRIGFASDIATQAASRAHMGLENQQLSQQMALQRYQMQHPEAFANPESVAVLGGQKVNLGQGQKGEDLTKAWENHQRLIERIDKVLPNAGTSYLPVGENKNLGTSEAGELKDALAAVSKTSPRLQKEEFDKRIGDNARSAWFGEPEKLRALRETTKSSLVDELQARGLNPTAARAYVEQKFPTQK